MNRFRGQAGITLIEVLASLAVFTAVAAGLMTLTVSTIKINNDSRIIAAATELVQNQIEKIRLIQPTAGTTPADLTVGTHNDANNPITALGAASGTFTRSWTVTTVSQYLSGTVVGARPDMVQVAVTVSWTTPTTRSVTAVTYACTTPNCGT